MEERKSVSELQYYAGAFTAFKPTTGQIVTCAVVMRVETGQDPKEVTLAKALDDMPLADGWIAHSVSLCVIDIPALQQEQAAYQRAQGQQAGK